MKYKYIVWDWNGTIIDDVKLSVRIFNEMCDSYGLPRITLERYKETFKVPVTDFYSEYGFDFSKVDFREISEYYVSRYNAKRFECSLHEGVVEAMSAMKLAGIGQSVLSAYEQNYLRDCVSRFNLNGYMDKVYGLGDILAGSKEDRARTLMAELDIDPKSVLMVGDTTHDKHAADAMGADCVFIAKGHCTADRLKKLGVPVFNNHKEFFDFVMR